jgi:hypothetical protein
MNATPTTCSIERSDSLLSVPREARRSPRGLRLRARHRRVAFSRLPSKEPDVRSGDLRAYQDVDVCPHCSRVKVKNDPFRFGCLTCALSRAARRQDNTDGGRVGSSAWLDGTADGATSPETAREYHGVANY